MTTMSHRLVIEKMLDFLKSCIISNALDRTDTRDLAGSHIFHATVVSRS